MSTVFVNIGLSLDSHIASEDTAIGKPDGQAATHLRYAPVRAALPAHQLLHFV